MNPEEQLNIVGAIVITLLILFMLYKIWYVMDASQSFFNSAAVFIHRMNTASAT